MRSFDIFLRKGHWYNCLRILDCSFLVFFIKDLILKGLFLKGGCSDWFDFGGLKPLVNGLCQPAYSIHQFYLFSYKYCKIYPTFSPHLRLFQNNIFSTKHLDFPNCTILHYFVIKYPIYSHSYSILMFRVFYPNSEETKFFLPEYQT